MLHIINTPRLQLVPISKELALKLTEVHIDSLCTDLQLDVLKNANYLNSLSELGVYFWAIADAVPWCAYFFIDKQTKTVVGNGGFKGRPQKNALEIGYEVYHKFYRQGYASEAVADLLNLANSKKIKTVFAETEVENVASIGVLEKNEFKADKKFINAEGEQMCAYVRKFVGMN